MTQPSTSQSVWEDDEVVFMFVAKDKDKLSEGMAMAREVEFKNIFLINNFFIFYLLI
jgi:hypothetical protein